MAKARGWPWKLPLDQIFVWKHERVVGHGVHFRFEDGPYAFDVPGGAVHLWYAPERVRVLHVSPGCSARSEPRARTRRCGPRSWRRLGYGCGVSKDASRPSTRSRLQGRSKGVGPIGEARHALGATMPVPSIICVPLMTPPLLGAELERGQPSSRKASKLTCRPSGIITSPSPINGNTRCASGAKSPDAPNEPWLEPREGPLHSNGRAGAVRW